MDKLCTTYSQSAKNNRDLQQAASTVESELLRVGRVLDIRWVAYSFRCVYAVWSSFAALHHHLKTAGDGSTDSNTTFSGLVVKLSSNTFLLNLNLC